MTLLVTGGAGFIGSHFVLDWLACHHETVVNVDALSYAGNRMNLAALADDPRHVFVHGRIGDGALLERLLEEHKPRAVLNFAAESHVDRSIAGPAVFVDTNVAGTFTLLEAVRGYWQGLAEPEKTAFRYLQVSTDEVYGSLGPLEAAFTETTPFAPNSPYAASKAAGDHLARAWHHSYGLPVLTTHCSNNYGPFQFPEKLIPLMIERALEGAPLPVYGDGLQVRDWLYVGDHCAALRRVLAEGKPGDTYNIGGNAERTNLEVVNRLCAILDEARPRADGRSYSAQVAFVADRPGHDRRYAINATKLAAELGWVPDERFDSGLKRTVAWYLSHRAWVDAVKSGSYRDWVARQYEARA
ncbi:dTDP-glucose 4,6-dehydratase [Crenobacter cavernae]|uniref:dTDP-glucose 4,6-dehydratase n=1 Tax=Crenobacter cavernae TaxID=2290923 RepID=A0ABY0FGE2_9NEIS|nr:dTDP-glucose 4,6-dehydratase [Crenobacter cavernae]RXZ45456.1 dTDP-glucose 4,6-dehydratase [Crenobacter cavernae]